MRIKTTILIFLRLCQAFTMFRIGFLYPTYNRLFGDFCHSFLRQVELEDYLFAPENIVVEFFVRQAIGLIPKNNNNPKLKVDFSK